MRCIFSPVWLLTFVSFFLVAEWPASPLARAALATETDPPAFTIERFLETPILYSPVVSPDGEQVAYLWTRRDLEDDTRLTQLWLADVKQPTTRRLSFADSGVRGVRWRPDGALSFIRTYDDEAQVWINLLDGSEPRPVTALAGGVGDYWWSPDGGYLAVLAAGEEEEAEETVEEETGDETDDTEETAGEETDSESATDTESDDPDPDREDWTVFDRLEQSADYQQVWVVAAGDDLPDDEKTGDDLEPRQLTREPWHPSHVAWSPDGATLAVTYNARFSGLVDEDHQVALIDVASGESTPITPDDRHSSLAAFSPDGKQLAYFTDREADYRAYLNLKDLVVRDLKTGATRVVTAGHQMALGGSGSMPGTAPTWSSDGKYLYCNAAAGTDLDLYRIAARQADKADITPVTDLVGTLGGFSIDGGVFAYVESRLHEPGTLYARPLKKDKPQRLATVNDAVTEYDLLPAKKLSLPGYDGATVEGYLFLPPDAGEYDRLPTIIEMHGGPYYRYGDAWTTRYLWQILSREGFAVFIANPRGGTGYGEDFVRGVYRNFGTDDYLDLMAAVDALVERGTADPDRLGFTGYSYGGLMTNVVISRTDRFQAAVSIAGIYNYVSAMGQSNPQLFIDSYRQPWAGDLQRLWEHSPASRADRITTPTLVMHGTEDRPVDPRQSIELFSYLQLNGVPSRLVLYPGEGHGINRPSHMLDYQTREVEWFRHYLLDDESVEGAAEPVPVEPTR